jgi:hypothetical protein
VIRQNIFLLRHDPPEIGGKFWQFIINALPVTRIQIKLTWIILYIARPNLCKITETNVKETFFLKKKHMST